MFGATPEMSPVRLTALAKGRVQHALRVAGKPVAFNRKVSLRSIGHSTRDTIEGYVRTQLKRERLADPRFEEELRRLSFHDPRIDLSRPSPTRSGRYWYNLHLVLVVAGRYRVAWGVGTDDIQVCYRRIARDGGHEISSLSFMPDHVHVALRGNMERSPQEIALEFQNGVADYMGCRIWEFNYYVGTFSEYTMEAVRHRG
jgi:REP element-mobilizing transposase RayT